MPPTGRVANGQGGYNCGVYVNPAESGHRLRHQHLLLPVYRWRARPSPALRARRAATIRSRCGSTRRTAIASSWAPIRARRSRSDGGLTWSSWYNQPTAQVYHISVDNQFPYWVYATQQDSGSIATSSRGNLGAITPLDWLPHPGYEFGSIVADPLNPKVSYAGGPGGGIIKTTYPSGQWIDVSPTSTPSSALRKVSNQPLLFSPRDPHELLAGFQCLMATTDGGKHWRTLGPDLTLKPGEKPPAPPTSQPARRRAPGTPAVRPPGARPPATPAGSPAAAEPAPPVAGQSPPEAEEDQEEEEGEAQRPGLGGAIESLSASSVDGNVIWVGTSNGLVKLSLDHGETWEDVSIHDLPTGVRADISAIDASHQDAGSAYAAVDCHGAGDYRPYVYRTHDYGRTWTPIVHGLPADEVRGQLRPRDPGRHRESGAAVRRHRKFGLLHRRRRRALAAAPLNLPETSVRDMVVKGCDLVVGTFGRGFWILDDISPLRQVALLHGSEQAHLFKPPTAIRIRRNVNGDTPFPPEVPHADNPPAGIVLYYYLGAHPSSPITLEVRDERGTVVRHLSSAAITAPAEPPPPIPDFWAEKPTPLPMSVGLNRTNWDLRFDSPSVFSHSYEMNANPGQTPLAPEGPLALPGVYSLVLTVDGKSYRQTLTVKNDPRSPASDSDLREQHALEMELYHCTQEAWAAYHEVGGIRTSIAAVLKASPPAEVAAAARALDTKLSAAAGSLGLAAGSAAEALREPRQPRRHRPSQASTARRSGDLPTPATCPQRAMRKVCAAPAPTCIRP